MLATSASDWLARIRADEQFRDARLNRAEEIKRRFHGPGYMSERGDGTDSYFPENFYFKYLGLMVPRLVHDNPRAMVRSRRPNAQGQVAEAMRHGLNRWVRDSNYRTTLDLVAYDYLMAWGVTLTSLETIPGNADQQRRWPRVSRVSPNRFGMDSFALRPEEARYKWHMLVRDKDDLLKIAKANPKTWNLEALENLAERAGTDKLKREADKYGNPPPNEIVYYEIWNAEEELADPNEGFHGAWYTLAVAATDSGDPAMEFIRPPRPAYCPPGGPHRVWGAYRVMDELYPLSPLIALEGQIQDLNGQVLAASNSNRRHKRFTVFQSMSPHDAAALKAAKDGENIALQRFDRNSMQEVEVGGSTPEQLQTIERLRGILNDVSGMGDPQSGSARGVGTATEQAIADEASTTRSGYLQSNYRQGTAGDLESVAWYMYHDDGIEFPLGEEVFEGSEFNREDGDVIFRGGDQDEESGATFEDLELEIEPYSMERVDEATLRRNAAEIDAIVTTVLPLAPQMPYLDIKQYLYLRGQMSNIPELGRVLDQGVLDQMMEREPEPGVEESLPRLSRDLRGRDVFARSEGDRSGPRPIDQRPKAGRSTGARAAAVRTA